MCIGFRSRFRLFLLNDECLFEVDERCAQLILLSVIAGKVIVRHGEAVVVVLGELFAALKEFVCLGLSTFAHVADGEHVTCVADLNAYFSELEEETGENVFCDQKWSF